MFTPNRWRTPHGNPVTILCRDGTSDGMVTESILGSDEYGLPQSLTGWALDIGAHIGVASVALAVDNPFLRVVAVEPVPDNADMIRRNAEENGCSDRVIVVQAGAAEGPGTGIVRYGFTSADGLTDEFVATNRFIGELFRDTPANGEEALVETVGLAQLVERFGPFAWAKTDAEGAEWRFFSDPVANASVSEIVGEYHDRAWPAIADLLGGTHTVTQLLDQGGTGLFRAVRK